MSSFYITVLSVIFLEIFSVSCEKILIMHQIYAGSHILPLRNIARELVSRGHEITVLRWAEANEIPLLKQPNISEIILTVNNSDGSIPFMSWEETAKFQFPLDLAWKRGLDPYTVFEGGFATFAASCRTLFENKSLLKKLKKEKFDLAIVDLIYNECELALAAHYLDLNVIGYWGVTLGSGESQYTTAFNPPSITPHLYFPYNDDMNFFQRVMNTLYGVGSHVIMQTQFSHANFYIQKYLKGCPHPAELLTNISGLLINSNIAFDYPKQLPPSFLNIGGVHINKDPKPLPENIQSFMRDADDGVILFSLGLTFDSAAMPKHVYEAYFAVFSRLKQKVIVKSRSQPAYIPSNVMVLPYFSQNDILAHPKTTLFLTHCGIHGVMEGIHHGVKMIGVPIFFDQINTAIRLKDLGVGTYIDKMATEIEIYSAVNEVLNDSRYEDRMKVLSQSFKSSADDPMRRAVWLIEHVMAFDGANHLKMRSRNLSFVQYFLIDVLGFLFLCLVLFVLLCYKSLRRVLRIYRSLDKIAKEKLS